MMFVLLKEEDGVKVIGQGTLEEMRALAKKDAAENHQADLAPIADDWIQNAVEAWLVVDSDCCYSIHELPERSAE